MSVVCVRFLCPLSWPIRGIWFYGTQMETSLSKITIIFKPTSKKGIFMEGRKDPNFVSHMILQLLSSFPSILPWFKTPLWLKRGIAWVICLQRIHLREKKGQPLVRIKTSSNSRSKVRESNTLCTWPSSSAIFNIDIVETEPDKRDNMTTIWP